jgi:DNA-binding NtrC family response regulator
MLKVLIVEDQPAVAKALTVLFEINDIPCLRAQEPAAARAALESGEVGLVIQDMNFSPGATSGEEGMAFFREVKASAPDLPVLAITAWTSLEAAVQMVKEGASDYLAKPWDDAKLLATVRNLLRLRELQVENQRLRTDVAASRQELQARHALCGVVYASSAMHRVVALAVQIAGADVPVLITGPNGAGKEKIAEIVQANSPRRDGPFVRVNAGALPDELLESELFGAEIGAFTGAVKRRVGRFEAAHGGTLFLDEIGNLSSAGQMKLLRVLQSGAFERLGSSETRKVDVRVLAATNVDLRAALAAGRFREDLFFRLNVIELAVPPLRERPDDVLPLAASFLRTFGAGGGGVPRTLSADAQAALLSHTWPGNVRELRNRIQRATLVSGNATLTADDLELSVAAPAAAGKLPAREEDAGERRQVEDALLAAQGSVSTAAARLGISRQALYRKMERLGIALERRPRS